MKRITNRRAGDYVGQCTPFKGSNLYGEALPLGGFVVYSYGPHWPLYIYDGCTWYENASRITPSTSRHRSQARPYTRGMGCADTLLTPIDDMLALRDRLTDQQPLPLRA